MFNLFKNKTTKEFMEEAEETYPTSVPEDKSSEEKCPYTIGPTSDGRTVLKVSNGYTVLTLTMAEVEVRRMIRLLEASISESNND